MEDFIHFHSFVSLIMPPTTRNGHTTNNHYKQKEVAHGSQGEKRGRASWTNLGARQSWHCTSSTNLVPVYCRYIINVTVRQ